STPIRSTEANRAFLHEPRQTGRLVTSEDSRDDSAVAATVAPEDLARGDFVAVLNETVEFQSFLWCDGLPGSSQGLVRVRFCAPEGGTPLKIKEICLPFVFVVSPCGAPHTLDVRRVQLVRLTKRYAKSVWKALQGVPPQQRLELQ